VTRPWAWLSGTALGVERPPEVGRGQRVTEGGPGVFKGDIFEIEFAFHIALLLFQHQKV
jgi:hypothetical protein